MILLEEVLHEAILYMHAKNQVLMVEGTEPQMDWGKGVEPEIEE